MKRTAVGLLLGFILGGGPACFAGDAFGVPISNKYIEGKIILPNGESAYIGAREGTLVTVQDHRTDQMFGFLPRITDGEELEALVMTVTIENNSVVRQLGDLLTIGPEAEAIKTNLGKISISFDDVQTRRLPKPLDPSRTPPATLEAIYGKAAGGSCCVTCDYFTICGSAVSLSCGSCEASWLMR